MHTCPRNPYRKRPIAPRRSLPKPPKRRLDCCVTALPLARKSFAFLGNRAGFLPCHSSLVAHNMLFWRRPATEIPSSPPCAPAPVQTTCAPVQYRPVFRCSDLEAHRHFLAIRLVVRMKFLMTDTYPGWDINDNDACDWMILNDRVASGML
jgi:hypothetical protein